VGTVMLSFNQNIFYQTRFSVEIAAGLLGLIAVGVLWKLSGAGTEWRRVAKIWHRFRHAPSRR